MMKKARRVFVCVAVLSLVCLFGVSAAYADNPEGKTYFSRANIWYENPENIPSTNYHKGAILPVGTKVKIVRYGRKTGKNRGKNRIEFTVVDKGLICTLIQIQKHSTINLRAFFDRYFSPKNPMARGGVFHTFTKDEQKNIKNGTIAAIMHRDAVIMAYGYPPSHKTPVLSSDIWKYWLDRFRRLVVTFRDDRIVSIARAYP